MTVAACADSGSTMPTQDVASAAVEPTFVRVTVTPVPIDTPTPTTVPASKAQFTAEQLAAPVFPEWLDPEIAAEQPSDDEIIRGWTEFLSNTVASFSGYYGDQFVHHFCADGTNLFLDTNTGELVELADDWYVRRNPAISSTQWGTVKVNPILP